MYVLYFSFFTGVIALGSGIAGSIISLRRGQGIALAMSIAGCIASGAIVLFLLGLASMGSMH